ncbi:MAG: nucleoside recognition domain-containing protein [Bacteroidota bacterium]
MLNYIWLSLIVIGIVVAIGTDISDLSSNKYHNGEQINTVLTLESPPVGGLQTTQHYKCSIVVHATEFGARNGSVNQNDIKQQAELIPGGSNSGTVHIFPDDQTPDLWKEIFKNQKNESFLLGNVRWESLNGSTMTSKISFDPVLFVKMNAVTNDGILKYAKTAVELSIGLIGIMALWLGVMKIAEQAGLIARLGNLLKPVTTRIFPDVPADHPAMGAMIMNISANMLGLSNAATPFGLKAMEELNKLNPKAGTATDAMCTFLVINTGNLQLIPATVIAIRAAAGSMNPSEIIGPVILATFITLTVGITVAKGLAKLPVFKRQLQN